MPKCAPVRRSGKSRNEDGKLAESHDITTIEQLEALYGKANPVSLVKETAYLTAEYRKWIEAAPFFAIASVGSAGLDCSPRGDKTGQLIEIVDDRTIIIPDRRGNNRLDTLRNIVSDPRVALLFLVPGINETLRINGRAGVSSDPDILRRFSVDGKLPATIIRVTINAVYYQCARALMRSNLWDPKSRVRRGEIPTAGQMNRAASTDFEAAPYDDALMERQLRTLY